MDFATQLTFETIGAPAVDEHTAVLITVSENCAEGALTLSASPEEGNALQIDEALSTKTTSMKDIDEHRLHVTIRPSDEGRFYFNVLASGALDDGKQRDRVFSVRVNVGAVNDMNMSPTSPSSMNEPVPTPMIKVENDDDQAR